MANRIATIETNMGTIKVELFDDSAPETAGNFAKLVPGMTFLPKPFGRDDLRDFLEAAVARSRRGP